MCYLTGDKNVNAPSLYIYRVYIFIYSSRIQDAVGKTTNRSPNQEY